jgi:VanZ family protein
MDDDEVSVPGWARWVAVVAVAGGILYASVLDPTDSGGLPPLGPLGLVGLDKWLHAVAYAGLAGVLAVALSPGRRFARAAVLAVVLAVGYGVALEFVQAPLPERYFSVADMAADAVGAVLAVLGLRVLVAVADRVRASGRR